jgi:hypothetical protein
MITVTNRKMTIPDAEKTIGCVGDNAVEKREFFLPLTYNSIDLTALSWRLEAAIREARGYAPLAKTVAADGLKLTWTIEKTLLPYDGHMEIQLKGYNEGDALVWHSDVDHVFVKKSVSAEETFPAPLPSEFQTFKADVLAAKAAAEAAEVAAESAAGIATEKSNEVKDLIARTPDIGENGNWWTWDIETEQYTDSGKPSRGEQGETGLQGPVGPQGDPPPIVNDDTTGGVDKAASAEIVKTHGEEINALDSKVGILPPTDNTNLFNGTYQTIYASSDVLKQNASSSVAKVLIESGKAYYIRVMGQHNRWIVGTSMTDIIGQPCTLLASEQGTFIDEKVLTFRNTLGHQFLWVNINYLYPFNAQIFVYEADNNSIEEIFEHLRVEGNPQYRMEFETMQTESSIDGVSPPELSLIAIKRDNTRLTEIPLGYLYLDEETNKLYYSKAVYDNPIYLCDWQTTIGATGIGNCDDYRATIAPNGSIIFIKRGERANPVVYPAGSYSSPVIVDLSSGIMPWGYLNDASIDHSPNGSFFVFGEYLSATAPTGPETYLWKVSSPYTNSADWNIVHTMLHSAYNDVGNSLNPEIEIAHFHTVIRDPISGYWYASTGDAEIQCRVLVSTDECVTWTDLNLGGGGQNRFVGFVITEDAAYYGTDSKSPHALYKVPRVSGVLDFANKVFLRSLSGLGQVTYRTVLLRDPYGLLLLDCAEPREDGIIDYFFYSLDDNTLYKVGTFEAIENYQIYEAVGRFQIPNYFVTRVQPPNEDGIICGSTKYSKPTLIKILDNGEVDYLGNKKIIRVLKVKIRRLH